METRNVKQKPFIFNKYSYEEYCKHFRRIGATFGAGRLRVKVKNLMFLYYAHCLTWDGR